MDIGPEGAAVKRRLVSPVHAVAKYADDEPASRWLTQQALGSRESRDEEVSLSFSAEEARSRW